MLSSDIQLKEYENDYQLSKPIIQDGFDCLGYFNFHEYMQ